MKVKVKLFGNLSQRFPDYKPSAGIVVALPDGARVRDLLTHLEIPKSREAIVSMDARIMNPDEILESGASVRVFQAVYGG